MVLQIILADILLVARIFPRPCWARENNTQLVKYPRVCISNRMGPSKIKDYYYSTITSFYHIRTRERAKYESVLHCSKRIAL